MNKASCLSLVSNAILVWNTLQIARIVETLQQTGAPIADEDLAHVSPLLHRHVIPNRTYHFPPSYRGGQLVVGIRYRMFSQPGGLWAYHILYKPERRAFSDIHGAAPRRYKHQR